MKPSEHNKIGSGIKRAMGGVWHLTLLAVLLSIIAFSSEPLAKTRGHREKKPAHVKAVKVKKGRRDPFNPPTAFKRRQESYQESYIGLPVRFNQVEGGQYVRKFQSGVKAIYTIDPFLQRTLDDYLDRNRVPYGVFVAINPNNGKILAMVEHSEREPRAKNLALRATYPAASIFKVVTASAAIEEQRAEPGTLISNVRRSNPATTLAEAFATSNNGVFSSLALHYLDFKTLVNYADRFQFNHKIPFELPVQVSRIKTKKSSTGLANLAAGFGDVGLSPIHAALIGSAIANDGTMLAPCLVDRVVAPSGKILFECKPKVFATAVSPQTAASLRKMMGLTISSGTGRHAFQSTRWDPDMMGISIGGKTGSLTGKNPPGKVSWFIGLAPLDNPEIAISALVINSPKKKWKVKASQVAREGFRAYFKSTRH